MADLTVADVRAKYPQYHDMSDGDLVNALHAKFYSDMPIGDFQKKVGFSGEPSHTAPGTTASDDSTTKQALMGPVGASETLLHGLTSAVAGIPSAAAYAGSAVGGALGLDTNPSADATSTHDYFTYKPQSDAGRELEANISKAASPVTQPLGKAANVVSDAADAAARKVGEFSPAAEAALRAAPGAANAVATLLPVAGAAKAGIAATGEAAAAEAASTRQGLGLRTGDESPIAKGAAGESGRAALIQQNGDIYNTAGKNIAGVPQSVDLSPASLKAAREAPNSVYDRAAASVPTGPITGDAATAIQNAGNEMERITSGSPDAVANINRLRQELLDKPVTGQQVLTENRALRQEGHTNIASDDISNQQLGKAQLAMADALETHIENSLPENGRVSVDQLRDARTALAQNRTIENALHGSSVDPQALFRAQKNGVPMTGDLAMLAKFAADNPDVSTLASRKYEGHTVAEQIGGAMNTDNHQDIMGRLFKLAGIPNIAKGPLLGKVGTDAAASIPRMGANGEFDPLHPAPGSVGPPTPPLRLTGPSMVNAGGGVSTGNTLADVLGLTPDVQAAGSAHPGAPRVSAPVETPPQRGEMPTVDFHPPGNYAGQLQPNGPVPAQGPAPGGVSLADLLSHGVEQPAAPGLTAGPMGAPAPQGLPFKQDAGHLAGDLQLGGEHSQSLGDLISDLAGIGSQGRVGARASAVGSRGNMLNQEPGVPEGITLRTNNASGESSASVEAINRDKMERAAGQDRFLVDPDGKLWPIRGVDAVDAKAPKGSIIIQKGVGAEPYSILDRGGLAVQHAKGLMNRAFGGGTGLTLADLLGGQ